MGGSKMLDRPDNLMLICPIWNGIIESDAAAASLARDWGHKLNSWDGFDTPVYDKTQGKWFLLDQFGEKQETHPPMFLI